MLYGRTSTALDQVATVSNAGLTTYTVDNLALGHVVLRGVAVNSAGVESDISNVATKTIVNWIRR